MNNQENIIPFKIYNILLLILIIGGIIIYFLKLGLIPFPYNFLVGIIVEFYLIVFLLLSYFHKEKISIALSIIGIILILGLMIEAGPLIVLG